MHAAVMPARVAIVGAGVAGLSVGLCLTDALGSGVDVTIVADKFSPHGIASDRAGAILGPPGNNYTGAANSKFEEDGHRWFTITYEWMRKVCGTGCGVEKIPIFRCYEKRLPFPWFKHLHPELRALSRDEIKFYGLPSRLQTVWRFNCFCIEPEKYLKFLSQKFKENGGLMLKKKIHSLEELSDQYDVIINCSGLGARELVGDLKVYPVRGQIVEVQGPTPPGLIYNIEPGSPDAAYIIPRNGLILLGTSVDKNNWSTDIDSSDTEFIYRNCLGLYPLLEGSKVVGGWAGLRPARDTVRLEVDIDFKPALLIHNYGHGGQGFIFSWGCATEVTTLVQKHLQNIAVPSKL